MKTESGALSVGAPNSAARLASEAEFVMRVENSYNLLLLTEEGRALLNRFACSVGCDFSKMDNATASNWIDTEAKALFSFLAGVTFRHNWP